jgi:hypothetical protein
MLFLVGVRNSLHEGGLYQFSPKFVDEKSTTFPFHEDLILNLSGSSLIISILSFCKKTILFSYEIRKLLVSGFSVWFFRPSAFILNNSYGELRADQHFCRFDTPNRFSNEITAFTQLLRKNLNRLNELKSMHYDR